MYAVIKTGGKQRKVKPGEVIEVERLEGAAGDRIDFATVLVVDDEVGTDFDKDLGAARVTGRLLGEEKGQKVRVFKYKNKTGYSRRQGHRQVYSLVTIEGVALGDSAGSEGASPEVEPAGSSAQPDA